MTERRCDHSHSLVRSDLFTTATRIHVSTNTMCIQSQGSWCIKLGRVIHKDPQYTERRCVNSHRLLKIRRTVSTTVTRIRANANTMCIQSHSLWVTPGFAWTRIRLATVTRFLRIQLAPLTKVIRISDTTSKRNAVKHLKGLATKHLARRTLARTATQARNTQLDARGLKHTLRVTSTIPKQSSREKDIHFTHPLREHRNLVCALNVRSRQ
jgi:hypothetical protein